MAEIKFTNIDLADIPRSLRNYTFVASDLALSGVKTLAAFNNTSYQNDEPEATSMLGTPVYDTITLGNLSDKSQNNYINILGEQTSFDPIRIHNAILEVSVTKNIVSSQPNGRNGTIKQYISRGDFSVTLNGRVAGLYDNETAKWTTNSNKFPQAGVKTIADICDVNANIDVSSFFLQEIFGITQVVIIDYNFFQREGYRNEQMFMIDMLSDSDTVLEFTEEEAQDNEFLNFILGT